VWRFAPLRAVGRSIRTRLGRRADREADTRLGRALLVALAVAFLAPLLAPVAGAAVWVAGAWRSRQRRRGEVDLVRRGLPEVVDLFVVGIGAGLNVPLALRAIGPLCPPPFADALQATVTQTELGMRTADAIESLPARLGEPVRPLSSALIASERYGVPLTASLERLADEVRRDRRRHAEASARRVPVKLLFPLVFCSLPALALLSVAPLIAGALRALRT
jgi:tight adherence protein C